METKAIDASLLSTSIEENLEEIQHHTTPEWVGFVYTFLSLSTGALDEGHFHAELENDVEQHEALAMKDAARVILHGLGEDVNREGIRKTLLCVAKALLEGTKGNFLYGVILVKEGQL